MNDVPEDEPMDLSDVDREIRINKLRNQIEDLTDWDEVIGGEENLTPEMEEGVMDYIFSEAGEGGFQPFGLLERRGVPLPPPEELDESSVHDVLWTLIQACAKRRRFFYCTDHLSDLELYTFLWSDGLRHDMVGFGLPVGNTNLSPLGGCSEEDNLLSLRYFSDDEERAWWAKSFPDLVMPPKEKPPYDRDRHLPRAKYH